MRRWASCPPSSPPSSTICGSGEAADGSARRPSGADWPIEQHASPMHVHPWTCACCASAHGRAWHVHACVGGATASRPTGRSAWRTACGFACCSTCSTRRRCACTRPQPSPHSMQHGLHSPVVTWPSHPPHPHPLYPQVLSFPPHACLYTSACTCCASLMCIMCMCTCTGALLPARGDERPHRLVARPILPVRGGGRRDAGEGGRRAICGLCGGRRARTRARVLLSEEPTTYSLGHDRMVFRIVSFFTFRGEYCSPSIR